jgi:two-component system sensor histidine kinase HydH
MTGTDSEPRYEPPGTPTPITSRTLHRERMRVSQNVAASIAHELRNPVFGITSAAQLLRYRNIEDPLIERNLGRILRETERLNSIIAALLEYGRPAPVELAPGDPDEVWAQVIAAHKGVLESRALLVHHTPPRDPAICNIDRDQLSQAFGNVLVNAIDAAPEGSDLLIHSTIDRDGSWRSHLHNDGPPIAADVLPRIFEPLVTTKPGHAGTGLAVAHRIVSDHGGSISIDTGADADPAAGTTLTFSLPPSRGAG